MRGTKGLISITIPFLNSELFLADAIESILSQSYTRWELLLVDDGSSDRSRAIALDYAARMPEKIRYLEHPGHLNRGTTSSRNQGVHHSSGEYLAFLDSDDVWLPEKLEAQVAVMDSNPEAGFTCGPSEYWYDSFGQDENTRPNATPPIAPADTLYSPPFLLPRSYPLGSYGVPCPSSYFLRRTAFDLVGGFEECFNPTTYQFFEDMAFLAKIFLNVPVFVSGVCLSRYRCHPSSMSESVESSGRYKSERLFYFEWLRGYLVKHSVWDQRIWCAVLRQTWRDWMPLPQWTIRLHDRIRHKS